MKTYKKTIEAPRLIIRYDETESPREWSNIGLFFTKESRSKSPDGTSNRLYEIMSETAEDAENTADHIKRIKEQAGAEFKASGPKDGNSHDENLHVIDIYPVYKYDHSAVSYHRGTAAGFDYSNSGFYIVTAESIAGETHTKESIEKCIDAELETYTAWCNGEVYSFILYGDDGEMIENCGGFYDIEDIREYLPEEWKNENLSDYLTH
jgi:hypothetical protein